MLRTVSAEKIGKTGAKIGRIDVKTAEIIVVMRDKKVTMTAYVKVPRMLVPEIAQIHTEKVIIVEPVEKTIIARNKRTGLDLFKVITKDTDKIPVVAIVVDTNIKVENNRKG
jgi:hypothetical protein